MNLAEGKLFVERCMAHPYVRQCYDQGDKLRSGQTKHGFDEHAIPVVKQSIAIADRVRRLRPGLIDDWTYHVDLPLGALFHDTGGCVSIEHHDTEGAKLTRNFLRTLALPGPGDVLPEASQKRIARMVAYHRASRYLKKNFSDPALDVVLLADKSIESEDRVRPGRAFVLGLLTHFGLASIPLRQNGEHDRIGFAIRNSQLEMDGDRMVLKMDTKDEVLTDSPLLFWRPKVDPIAVEAAREFARQHPASSNCLPRRMTCDWLQKLTGYRRRRVSTIYDVVLDHPYYKKNFHAMEVAARNLGFLFNLQFNATPFTFDMKLKQWVSASV